MSLFLVEHRYYNFKMVVEAGSSFGARYKAILWLQENKRVHVSDLEIEAHKITSLPSDPDIVRI